MGTFQNIDHSSQAPLHLGPPEASHDIGALTAAIHRLWWVSIPPTLALVVDIAVRLYLKD